MDSSLFMDTQVGVGECDLLLELDPSILKKKRRTSIRRTIISLLLSATHTLLSQLMPATHTHTPTHTHRPTPNPIHSYTHTHTHTHTLTTFQTQHTNTQIHTHNNTPIHTNTHTYPVAGKKGHSPKETHTRN